MEDYPNAIENKELDNSVPTNELAQMSSEDATTKESYVEMTSDNCHSMANKIPECLESGHGEESILKCDKILDATSRSTVKVLNNPSEGISEDENQIGKFTPTSYTLSYDELNRTTDLNQFKSPIQSIYKLAYDENSNDSRPPSPDGQVPSSIERGEILIHEAETDSDAGSEDVELLPHRYESESYRNENKHMYVNKLSLAVELLRTHENLPYDDEFKRVENENNPASGAVNLAYVDDTCSTEQYNTNGKIYDKQAERIQFPVVLSFPLSAADSGVQSEDSADDIPEDIAHASEPQRQRRPADVIQQFGVQTQHRLNIFPTRTALVNPCLCCVIM